ncbi:MAG: tetratricopeptide repeat protein [Limnospira sp. PMC 1291.21]|uniref:tetratricopeptide repeat protein n=1 Tax=Limnospira TaxID=2596745 RepID=UPI0002804357|nr:MULTISPECIES: tetratricopeptide repeat protein [Limnospira]EKD09320.1 putative TPR repeat protein [Arthrospira platensis C1]MDY7051043.1 tetratricopeptide repeat protein [Limnospira fusiformis LS22]MDT9179886.1 tetratricopeptide repeat protein [Limnospira sp. PMC 1238.20]MDT9205374.1 tetratricopeptide repeat protein [Limnospira sp. PMC 1243.20]MDT9225836.1 tetratricopeptide repeat protein [Limnospira sp. PMC 1279.21]
MRLSTLTLLTLTALAANESVNQATAAPNVTSSYNPVSDTENLVDEIDIEISQAELTATVSAPETWSQPELAEDSSLTTDEVVFIASASPALSVAKVSPSVGTSEFGYTVILLNTLLLISTLSPTLTLMFFWLVRRLVIRELVTETNKRLDKFDGLESQLKSSNYQSKKLVKDLEIQVRVAQKYIQFLRKEVEASKASIQELEHLKLQYLRQVQEMMMELQNYRNQTMEQVEPPGVPVPAPPMSQLPSKSTSNHPLPPKHPPTSQPLIADDFLKKGEALINERQYKQAIAACDRALEINPDLDEAWYQKGNALVRLQQYSQALECYDRALKIQPQRSDAWYNRGNVLVRLKRYSPALEAYNQALKIEPNDYAVWHNRGALLRKFQKYEQALDSYDRAIRLEANHYETWHNRGNVLSQLKRYQEAISSYDRAIQINPGQFDIWANRGMDLCHIHQYSEALSCYEQAISLNSKEPELWISQGGVLVKLARHEEAVICYDRAISLKSDSYEAWMGRGEILTALKQYEQALANWDRVIALQPDAYQAWCQRGICLEKMEQHDDAIACFDTAIALKPDHAESWRHRGALLSRLKKYQEAIASLGKAISIQKDLRNGKKLANASQSIGDNNGFSPVPT